MQNTNMPQQSANPIGLQQQLPNSTAILVLGIISLVLCGIIGLVCGIIALSMAGKAKKLYEANPSLFTESSWKNASAGKTCAIIGVILSCVVFVLTIVYIIAVFAVVDNAINHGSSYYNY